MTAPLDLDGLAPVALWRDEGGLFHTHDCGCGDPATPHDNVSGDPLTRFATLPLATYTALVSELRAAREALAFYADRKSYALPVDADGDEDVLMPIERDSGARALLTLSRAATGGDRG